MTIFKRVESIRFCQTRRRQRATSSESSTTRVRTICIRKRAFYLSSFPDSFRRHSPGPSRRPRLRGGRFPRVYSHSIANTSCRVFVFSCFRGQRCYSAGSILSSAPCSSSVRTYSNPSGPCRTSRIRWCKSRSSISLRISSSVKPCH